MSRGTSGAAAWKYHHGAISCRLPAVFLGGFHSQAGSPIFFLARWPPLALGLDPTNVKIQEMLASPRIPAKSQDWISVLILWVT